MIIALTKYGHSQLPDMRPPRSRSVLVISLSITCIALAVIGCAEKASSQNESRPYAGRVNLVGEVRTPGLRSARPRGGCATLGLLMVAPISVAVGLFLWSGNAIGASILVGIGLIVVIARRAWRLPNWHRAGRRHRATRWLASWAPLAIGLAGLAWGHRPLPFEPAAWQRAGPLARHRRPGPLARHLGRAPGSDLLRGRHGRHVALRSE